MDTLWVITIYDKHNVSYVGNNETSPYFTSLKSAKAKAGRLLSEHPDLSGAIIFQSIEKTSKRSSAWRWETVKVDPGGNEKNEK